MGHSSPSSHGLSSAQGTDYSARHGDHNHLKTAFMIFEYLQAGVQQDHETEIRTKRTNDQVAAANGQQNPLLRMSAPSPSSMV